MSTEEAHSPGTGDEAVGAFQLYLASTRDGEAPDREACLASVGADARPRLASLLDDLELIRTQRRLLGPDSGQRIGPYRLLDQLGRGGASIVWRGLDERLGREVAIKILHPFLAISSAPLARFEREARLGAGLDHPHIAKVLDVGEVNGTQYIVEELVPGGRTLAKWIAERAARVIADDHDRAVARIGEAACRGLAAAHAAGIVHRDVKPSNVLMTPDDRPLLCDFGLAKLRDTASRSSVTAGAGTPCYSSPEQLSGAPTLNERSDVFSLGVTLYEALTLRRPFDGDTAQGVTAQVLHHDPPPPARLRSTLSAELSSVCMMAMEKDPAQRYANAAEMGADLSRWLAGRSVVARPPRPLVRALRAARRFPVVTTCMAAAALLVTLAVSFSITNAALRSKVQLDNEHLREMLTAARSAAEYMSPSRVHERGAEQPAFLDDLARGARLAYADDPGQLSLQLAEIGRFHGDLGFASDAAALCAEAARLREALDGPADPRSIALRLAEMDALEQDFAHDRELAVGEALLALDGVREDAVLRAQVLSRMDRVLTWTEDLESLAGLEERHGKIEATLRAALDALAPGAPQEMLRLRLTTDLGRHLSALRRSTEATDLLEENYDAHLGRLGAEHIQTLLAGYWYGRAYDRLLMETGHWRRTSRLEVFAPLSATADRVLGPTSRLGLELRWKVGEAKLYDPARDALGDYDHVYAELGRWLAPDHPRMLSLRTARAMSMTPTSRHAEAVAELREVIRLKTEVYGTPHASTLIARRALGQALTYSGRFEEALEEYREQYRLFSEPPRSPSDIDAHWSAMLICGTLMQLSRFDEARHRTLEVIAALERAGIDEGWSSAQLSVSMYMLAESSFALRDFAGAREQLTGALEHSGASLAQPDAPGETIRYWRIDAALTLAEDARDGTRRGLRPAPAIAPGGGPRPMITLLTTLYALRDGELEAVPEALALLAAEPRFLGSPDALPTRLLDDLAAGLRALPPEHRSDAEPFLAALAAARER